MQTSVAPRDQASAGAAHDFIQPQIIGAAAQIFAQLAFGKGAELAFEITHIGIIDVAVDHIAHHIAADPRAQIIGGLADGGEIRPARLKQGYDFRLRQASAAAGLIDQTTDDLAGRAFRALALAARQIGGGRRACACPATSLRRAQSLRYRAIAAPVYATPCPASVPARAQSGIDRQALQQMLAGARGFGRQMRRDAARALRD